MTGADGVVTAVAHALRTRLPAITTARRGQDPTLPDIQAVLTHEPDHVGIEQWPLVVVTCVGDRGWQALPEGGQWRVRYALRVHTWVRGDGYAETTRRQRVLHTAVLQALLAEPLQDPLRLDEASVESSLSDVAVTEQGRTIAGARLDLQILATESLTVPGPRVGQVAVGDIAALPQ